MAEEHPGGAYVEDRSGGAYVEDYTRKERMREEEEDDDDDGEEQPPGYEEVVRGTDRERGVLR